MQRFKSTLKNRHRKAYRVASLFFGQLPSKFHLQRLKIPVAVIAPEEVMKQLDNVVDSELAEAIMIALKHGMIASKKPLFRKIKSD